MILILVKNNSGLIQERIAVNQGAQFRTYPDIEREFEKSKEYNSLRKIESEKNFKLPGQTRWP